MPTFNPRAFIRELLAFESPDGCDVQDLAETHGIVEDRPLTAAEIADGAGRWHEYDCKEGDLWPFTTPAYDAWLRQQRR